MTSLGPWTSSGWYPGCGIGHQQTARKFEPIARSDTGSRRDEVVPPVWQRFEPQGFGDPFESQLDHVAGRSPETEAHATVGEDFGAERHHMPDGRDFG